MEIIRQEERPEDRVHEGVCNMCATEVKFKQSEGKVTDLHDVRDGRAYFVTVQCPTCRSDIHVNI